MSSLIALLVIVALFLFWIVGVYNRLVTLRNRFKNSFSQIDVQLKRRYDLIPNLVEVAKNYMQHERVTLEAVIAARGLALAASSKAARDPADPSAVQQFAAAENTLNASMGKLFALSEAYPDLKANENMQQLSEELSSTENKIAFARQAYNDQVMHYNIGIEQFPASVVANSCGFKSAEMLQVIEAAVERQAVKVAF